MTMTTRGCPLHDTLVGDVKKYLNKIDGVGSINVEIVWDPPWSIEKMNPAVREKDLDMGNLLSYDFKLIIIPFCR